MKHRAVIAKRLAQPRMFSNVVSKHDAPCGNREALATEGTQVIGLPLRLSKNVFVRGFRGRAPIKKQPRQGFDALSVP